MGGAIEKIPNDSTNQRARPVKFFFVLFSILIFIYVMKDLHLNFFFIQIVPATLKRQVKQETARARPSAPRSEGSKLNDERGAYRRTPGLDKKADVGAGTGEMEFRGGFGRGKAPQ